MAASFCHIAPTEYLHLTKDDPTHLILAHLVESDEKYTQFYRNTNGGIKILDNSAFEMYKEGRPMYPSAQLIEMGKKVGAKYIVMSDYPDQPSQVTIDAAVELYKEFKDNGFGTFFCPQSKIGDYEDLMKGFEWAANHPEIVDYIGVSILAVPNAYGVERDNKLQRFVSRTVFMYALKHRGILDKIKANGQKIHMLGMVDGPNEIILMNPFKDYINTWDSSAAIWAGLNGVAFDQTPTGLVNGKFEKEVDFKFKTDDPSNILYANLNETYIDILVRKFLNNEV